MLRQIEREIQNGPIKKSDVLPLNSLFSIFNLSIRASHK